MIINKLQTYLKSDDAKKNVLLVLGAIVVFMQMMDANILNVALPSIAADMGENPLQMQPAVISYMFTVAFFIPVSGWFSDYFGVKRAFIFSVCVFILGSVFCALSNTLIQLVLSRVLQAAGGAVMIPVGRLAVMRTFSKKKLVWAISLITMAGLIGQIMGPFVGGVIVQYSSWRYIFLINFPIGIVCSVAAYYIMKYEVPLKPKFDWRGYMLFGCVILFISLSTLNIKQAGANAILSFVFFITGLFFMLAYAKYALTKPWRCLFKPRLFYEKNFRLGMVANFLLRYGGGVVAFLMPLMLQTALGYSPVKSAATIMPMIISSIIAKPFGEIVLNTFGYKKFLFYNTILVGLCLISFVFIRPGTNYYFIMALLAFLGVFNSLQFTALNTVALITVPARDLSQANSLVTSTMQLSTSIGIAIACALLVVAGKLFASNPQVVLISFHFAFAVLGCATTVGAVIFISPLARGMVERPKEVKTI